MSPFQRALRQIARAVIRSAAHAVAEIIADALVERFRVEDEEDED